jgi:hypothetical protein
MASSFSSSSSAGAPKDAAYSSLNPTVQRADPATRAVFTALPMSTEDRAILRFYPTAACTGGRGFAGDDLLRPPPALAARGVTDADWRRFVARLERDVQPQNMGGLLMCVSWTVLVLAPLVCVAQRRYHAALGRWVADLNREVLEPRGLFAKFQTSQVNSKDYHEEQSWLAVSLNRDDAEVLRAEPVFWRPACCDTSRMVRDECQCKTCCGVERVV